MFFLLNINEFTGLIPLPPYLLYKENNSNLINNNDFIQSNCNISLLSAVY